jgi:hypothetical protein
MLIVDELNGAIQSMQGKKGILVQSPYSSVASS